ncbi:MAG: hypothetical protein AAGF12_40780, partial [Myxococcota bacterium]
GGGRAALNDVIVRGVRENAAGDFGRGLHVEDAGTLNGQRILVDDCRELGVYGSSAGAEVVLADLIVRGTRPRIGDGAGGRGVQFQWGVTATIERAVLENNVGFGLMAAAEGTVVTVRDVAILNTDEGGATDPGRGAEVLLGARLDLERVRIENSHDIGYGISGSASTASHLAVVGTKPTTRNGWYGRGIAVIGAEAVLDGDHVRVADNTEIGVYVGTGTVTLRDAEVVRTNPQPCTVDCMGRTGGFGVLVISDGTVTMSRFTVSENALAGLALVGGRAPLDNGTIAGHPVGIYAAENADAVANDLREVELESNDRNFDSAALPIPDASIAGTVDF